MNYRLITAGFVGLVLLSSAATVSAAPTNDAPPNARPGKTAQAAAKHDMQAGVESRAAAAEFHTLAGEIALRRKDLDMAARQYAAALDLAPSAALAERATRVAATANQSALAFTAAQIWVKDSPQDADALRSVVRLSLVRGDVDTLEHFIPALAATAPSPRAGYEQVAGLLGERPDQASIAIKAMQQVARSQATPAAEYALALTAFEYNHFDIAGQAVKKVRRAKPHWDDPALLSAAIAVQQGDVAAARDTVAALKGNEKARAGYHVALAHMLLQAGRNDAAAKEFHTALAIDAKQSDAHFGLGIVLLSKNQLDAARKQFEALESQNAKNPEAAFYLGAIAEQQGRLADARRWYAQVSSGPDALTAGVHEAMLTARAGQLSAAMKQLDALAANYPDHDADIASVKADLLVTAGQLKKALALYNQALAAHADSAALLYGRALVDEKLGRVAPAESDLEHLIHMNGNDAPALNALGYMLTNHSAQYARAEKLIQRALDQDPDDPAILDSLGWVQYKRGQLAAAQKHLEKAYDASHDPEIAFHLGTVRWAAGDHAAARAVWQKAAKANPDNKELQQAMREHQS